MGTYRNEIICACPRCGKVVSESVSNEGECNFCGCTMIKTRYTVEEAMDYDDITYFNKKVCNEYVYGNPLYSDSEYQHRLEQEYRKFYGSSSVLRCPNCGSTAITTGQRGYSVIYGFAGSSRTVNRCGNCGYKWEP